MLYRYPLSICLLAIALALSLNLRAQKENFPAKPKLFKGEKEVQDLFTKNSYSKALRLVDSLQAVSSDNQFLQRLNFYEGKILLNQDEYEASLPYLIEALKYFREHGPEYYEANTKAVLAMWKVRHGRIEEALEYYEESLRIFEKLEMPDECSKVQGNMGILYHSQGQRAKARHAFKNVEKIAMERGDSISLTTAYLNLGRFFLYQDEHDSSWYYFRKAEKTALAIDDSLLWADALRGKAELLEADNRMDSAAILWKQSIAVYKTFDQRRSSLQSYQHLIANLEQRGFFEQANRFLREWSAVKDSIYVVEQQKAIAAYEDKLETAQIEYKFELLEARRKSERRQKYLYLILAVLAVLLVFVVIWKWRHQKHLLRAEQEVNRKERALQRAEQERLRQEVENKQRSLTKESLRIVQKNQQLEELKKKLRVLNNKLGDEARSDWVSINSAIKYALNVDREWEEFGHYFEGIHPRFQKALNEVAPALTDKEKRLCALLKIGMNTKEIASVLGISPASVKKARTRLRKKLNLREDQGLQTYLDRLQV